MTVTPLSGTARRSLQLQRRVRAATAAVLASCAAGSVIVGGAGLVSASPSKALACVKVYEVMRGDSWFGIAKKHGVTSAALYKVNETASSSPLFPGGKVCLPDNASATPATVASTTTPVASTTTPTAPTTPAAGAASPPTVQLAAFPVQGPCWYADTWMAPRGGGRKHEGVDLIAKAGQYVYAALDGTLTRQVLDRPGSLSGNGWWLTAADGTYLFYAHLSAFAPDVSVGSKVVAGQIIGFIGRTGNTAGPHLHFEVHPAGGAAVNPTAIVRAVDGCKTTTPLLQPSGILPPTPSTLPPAGPATGTATPTTPTTPTTPATTPATTTPPAQLTGSAGGLWQFFAPKTAYDSAWSATPVGKQVKQTIKVAGLAGVPTGTGAVMLRLTAQGASAGGYVAVHPCDLGTPAVSALSFAPGGSAVSTAVVRVSGGNVCAMASTSVRLKVEVIAAQAASGVGLQPITANRVLDTRTTTRLAPGTTVTLSPTALGAPVGAQALTASITIVGPARAGTLSMGFCGQGPWSTPVSADAVSSFSMTMRTSSSGWCLTSSVPMDVIVDVVGAWVGSVAPSPVNPTRIFDSRSAGAPVSSGVTAVPVAGIGPVPGGVANAVLSVTVVTRDAGTSVFATPCGEGRGSGTVIAASANRITTAVIPVRLGGGAVCFSALNDADVIVDVLAAG